MHHAASNPLSFSHSSSSLTQPSPIKKKVSLGEYFSRRKGSQPTTDMPANSSPTMQQGAFKTPTMTSGDFKDGEMRGNAVVDTPKKEATDPMAAEQSKESKL